MNQNCRLKQIKVITIDGPAGAGKTTVSKRLAGQLGCLYVDTGALYRGVAYEVTRCQVDIHNHTELESLLASLYFEFRPGGDDGMRLFSSGQDISGSIRTPEISMLASSVSAIPQVREALLDIQKEIAGKNSAVFEGRDMGTVVFPDADYKFFLVADLDTRASRRFSEMGGDEQNEKKSEQQTLDEVKASIAKRDHNDSTRKEAPLKAAPDAVKIDSTHLTPDEVVEQLLNYICR